MDEGLLRKKGYFASSFCFFVVAPRSCVQVPRALSPGSIGAQLVPQLLARRSDPMELELHSVVSPEFPSTCHHPLWQALDLEVETCLNQLMDEGLLRKKGSVHVSVSRSLEEVGDGKRTDNGGGGKNASKRGGGRWSWPP